MLPINDTEPNRYSSFSVMTLTLIVVNTIIFILESLLPDDLRQVIFFFFGFSPRFLWMQVGAGVISVVTSTFLHIDIFHLLGNMLFLWVFGRRVEDACGPLRFLLYYMLAGVSAVLITAIVIPDSPNPGIGASGAISGLIGAYLVLFPTGRIRTLIFIPFTPIPTWPRVRAFWYIFYYIATQVPSAIIIYNAQKNNLGIGYWAHLGGFFACIFIPLFLRPEAFARYVSDVLV